MTSQKFTASVAGRAASPSRPPRLATWLSEAGRPTFLSTVPGGFLDSFADRVESEQLAWAGGALADLERIDPTSGSVSRSESVTHLARAAVAAETAVRVAESRGRRLAQRESDDAAG